MLNAAVPGRVTLDVHRYRHAGNVRGQFFAYGKNFRGGVNIAAGDADNDGINDIITGAGPGGTPHVRVFKSNTILVGSFYAYEEKFSGGVNIGIIESKK